MVELDVVEKDSSDCRAGSVEAYLSYTLGRVDRGQRIGVGACCHVFTVNKHVKEHTAVLRLCIFNAELYERSFVGKFCADCALAVHPVADMKPALVLARAFGIVELEEKSPSGIAACTVLKIKLNGCCAGRRIAVEEHISLEHTDNLARKLICLLHIELDIIVTAYRCGHSNEFTVYRVAVPVLTYLYALDVKLTARRGEVCNNALREHIAVGILEVPIVLTRGDNAFNLRLFVNNK